MVLVGSSNNNNTNTNANSNKTIKDNINNTNKIQQNPSSSLIVTITDVKNDSTVT